MNVLVLTPRYNTYVKDSVESLSKHVNHIDVFIHHNYFSEISPYLPRFNKLEDIKKFQKKNLINNTNKPKNVDLHLTSFFYLIPDGININLGKRIFKYTDKIIKKENIKFDLIHAHFIWNTGYAGVKLKEKYKKPLIITGHGFDIKNVPFRNKKYYEKTIFTIEKSDHIITVSKKYFEILNEKLGIDRNKISVIPNGINIDKFKGMNKNKVRTILNLPKDKKIILNIGNLLPVKGQKILIKSMKNMVSKRDDLLCLIIGEGYLKKELQKMINRYNLQSDIKMLGGKHHSEIPYWMNSCDIYVQPSIHESFGVVLIESLACGKPVVASKVGGIPEIINSQKYGYLCDVGDTNDFTNRILQSINKEYDVKIIRKHALNFSLENNSKKLLKIYNYLDTN